MHVPHNNNHALDTYFAFFTAGDILKADGGCRCLCSWIGFADAENIAHSAGATTPTAATYAPGHATPTIESCTYNRMNQHTKSNGHEPRFLLRSIE